MATSNRTESSILHNTKSQPSHKFSLTLWCTEHEKNPAICADREHVFVLHWQVFASDRQLLKVGREQGDIRVVFKAICLSCQRTNVDQLKV